MATLTTKTTTEDDGLIPLQAASSGGDEFVAEQSVRLVVENTSGASRQLTFASEVSGAQKGIIADDWVVNIPDTEEHEIMPSQANWDAFKNSVTGRVAVTYDNEVGLRVAAVKR